MTNIKAQNSSDGIYLTPYNPAWPSMAKEEANLLRIKVPHLSFEVEHIGSTAIPGLAAKPVVDLLVGVDSLSNEGSGAQPCGHPWESICEISLPDTRLTTVRIDDFRKVRDLGKSDFECIQDGLGLLDQIEVVR